MRFFIKALKDWLDGSAPEAQSPTGLKQDQDFNPPTGPIGVLRAMFRDRVYEISERDLKRLRPEIVLDPRAVANRKARAEARARRQSGSLLIPLEGLADDVDPYLPPAKILPPARRSAPEAYDDTADIIWPQGQGDGRGR